MRRMTVFAGVWLFLLSALTAGLALAGADGAFEAWEAEAAAKWKYPGASSSGGGGGGGRNPLGWEYSCHQTMRTKDDYKKVVKYYEEMFRRDRVRELEKRNPGGQELVPARKPPESGEGDFTSTVAGADTTTFAHEDSAGRKVKLRVFAQTGKSSSLTLVINRAEGEDWTHIVWTYFEWSR